MSISLPVLAWRTTRLSLLSVCTLAACADPSPQYVGAVLLCPGSACAVDDLLLVGTVLEVETTDESGGDTPADDYAVSIWPGIYGAWQHLVIEEQGDGMRADAWLLIPSSLPLAEVGETVHVRASSDLGGEHLLLTDGDGALRAWVGMASTLLLPEDVDATSLLHPPDGVGLTQGEVAWTEHNRCGTWEHRDLVLTEGGDTYSLPYGALTPAGSMLAIHAGHKDATYISSRIGCDAGLGLISEVQAALLGAAYTAEPL